MATAWLARSAAMARARVAASTATRDCRSVTASAQAARALSLCSHGDDDHDSTGRPVPVALWCKDDDNYDFTGTIV